MKVPKLNNVQYPNSSAASSRGKRYEDDYGREAIRLLEEIFRDATSSQTVFFNLGYPRESATSGKKIAHGRNYSRASLREAIVELLRDQEAVLQDISGLYFALAAYRPKCTTRSRNNVQSIGVSWVDLDIYRSKIPGLTHQDAIQQLEGICKQDSIPLPSAYVFTGHGLHVYWLHEQIPISSKRKQECREADHKRLFGALCERFTHLGADKDACGVYRLLRLPGSVHRKSAERACLLPNSTFTRYRFDALLNAAAPPDNKPTNGHHQLPSRDQLPHTEDPSEQNAPSTKKVSRKGLSLATYGRALSADLLKLVHARFGNDLPDGYRDQYVHLLHSALVHFMPPESALREIVNFAQKFCGWDESKTKSKVSSSHARALDPDVSIKYTYSVATLLGAAHLDVLESEMRDLDLRLLINDVVRRERKAAEQAERRRREGAIPHEHSIASLKPWLMYGLSRTSWYRTFSNETRQAQMAELRQGYWDNFVEEPGKGLYSQNDIPPKLEQENKPAAKTGHLFAESFQDQNRSIETKANITTRPASRRAKPKSPYSASRKIEAIREGDEDFFIPADKFPGIPAELVRTFGIPRPNSEFRLFRYLPTLRAFGKLDGGENSAAAQTLEEWTQRSPKTLETDVRIEIRAYDRLLETYSEEIIGAFDHVSLIARGCWIEAVSADSHIQMRNQKGRPIKFRRRLRYQDDFFASGIKECLPRCLCIEESPKPLEKLSDGEIFEIEKRDWEMQSLAIPFELEQTRSRCKKRLRKLIREAKREPIGSPKRRETLVAARKTWKRIAKASENLTYHMSNGDFLDTCSDSPTSIFRCKPSPCSDFMESYRLAA